MPNLLRLLAPVLLTAVIACDPAASAEPPPPDDNEDTAQEIPSPTTKSAALPPAATETKTETETETGTKTDPVVGTQSEGSLEVGDPPAAVPAPAPVVAPPVLPYRGVNLAGAEFAGSVLPGVEGRDYGWPTRAEVDYFVGKGMNTFRVGFAWERMQAKQLGELTPAYVAKLDDLVAYATGKGAHVILNPHNFARYYGVHVGSATVPASAFADLWRRLAARYAGNGRVIFNLVNEPNGLPTEQWVTAANAALAAIRAAGAKNVVHVPGNAWTGAHSWNQTWYGTSNAKAMLGIVDPGDNMVFEVHQYLDATSGGVTGVCVSPTIGRERLAGFISWLRANGKKGFVGELAGGDNAVCNAAVTDMMAAMNEAADVLVGWLWWAAGPRWNPTYPFSIEPKNGVDAPQMALLAPYLQ